MPSGLAIVAPFAAAYFASYLLRTVNAVLAPELVRAVGVGPAELGLLTSTYFLSFAVAQLPVGLALDRWGPRRVVGVLMIVAALGVVVFARGEDLATLAVGRALAGLGVSACLMGGFKAFAAAFPPERQASLTGLIMAAGAAGALAASLPLAAVLPFVGWRWVLLGVAGLCAALTPIIWWGVPRWVAPGRAEPWGVQVRGLLGILRAGAFWRYAPQATFVTGGFMAFQGLWAVPYVMNAQQGTREHAAGLLFLTNGGLLAGQLVIALGGTMLHRAGLSRERLLAAGLTVALAAEALLLLGWGPAQPVWFALGAGTAVSAQLYGVAAARFPAELWGRVSTAINLMAFVGAFGIQWGAGVAVDHLAAAGWAVPRAFVATFGLLWAAKVVAVALGLRR